jgi:UDP-N-acetylglucosamine diphosphorylase/glucosamine-1-phosphate N-acetyltransferase
VVFGGPVGTSSIGPVCKVRGEVAESVLLGYVNKAHDGHLGHALLGRWVNLGAATINSDLKNNYRPVRVWTPTGEEDTGLTKVGCFLGDHVKTGIGTVLNTGTVVGAGSNVFGGLMPPTVVPAFSWGAGDALTTYRFDKFLETAEAAMARRGQTLTPGVRDILAAAWEATRAERGET